MLGARIRCVFLLLSSRSETDITSAFEAEIGGSNPSGSIDIKLIDTL